eukprot:NODE_93_length_21530_cov_0.700387.p5 type:complete len:484 gc:universal NODE_93_length_21530_cov_0.700387:6120-7571(+)
MVCASDHFISSLKHFGGYIDIKRGSMYYYHVPQLSNKTLIWTNGGPGCSALEGMLLENGPYKINKTSEHYILDRNPFSWDQFANIIYVDQPMNTGFSKGGFVSNQTEVATDMVEFVINLFKIYPLLKDNELYIAGESFAGQYIPYITKALIENSIPVKGMIIGNGWIDPRTQYRAYIDFAIQRKLLDGPYLKNAEDQYQTCLRLLNKMEKIGIPECEHIANIIFDNSRTRTGTCLNMYDSRLSDDNCGADWPYNLPRLYEYLQDPKTVELIHANPDQKWVECRADTVGDHLKGDLSKPSFYLLEELLKKTTLYLYSGDMDFICNHLGTESLISRLNWNGYQGFQNEPVPLYLEENVVGIVQNERNLVYLKIKDGSHMLPVDQPEVSMHLIKHILDNSFLTGTSHMTNVNTMKDHVHVHEHRAPSVSGLVALAVIIVGMSLYLFMKFREKKAQQYELQVDPSNEEIPLENKVLFKTEYEDPEDV